MENVKCKMENPPRVVLGIDPGTGRLGWGVVSKTRNSQLATRNSNSVELIDCGVLETPAKTPLPDRLEFIFNGLKEVIKKYEPTELAIEELFFVKNIKTGISVAHARGVAMLAGKQAGIEIFEYKPNEIKLSICGYGHADKKQMAKMVELHIRGCKIKQDDAADAVAVALTHLQISKSNQLSAIRNQLNAKKTI